MRASAGRFSSLITAAPSSAPYPDPPGRLVAASRSRAGVCARCSAMSMRISRLDALSEPSPPRGRSSPHLHALVLAATLGRARRRVEPYVPTCDAASRFAPDRGALAYPSFARRLLRDGAFPSTSCRACEPVRGLYMRDHHHLRRGLSGFITDNFYWLSPRQRRHGRPHLGADAGRSALD